MEISLEWGATRICTRAYFIVGIHQWFRGRGTRQTIKMYTVDDRKTKEIGDHNMTLIKESGALKNGRCYSIFGKYKCLHTGPGNTGINYEMGGTILSKPVKEKDLGVTMNANMKVSE